jgi:adenine-specific DNA-methyltransferase
MAQNNLTEWSKTELIKEVKKLRKRKKYGILWEDKSEEVAELCKEKLPYLKEEDKKEILTDKKESVNILIEGDNYHALSVLNYTHKNKIDVIFIDPPYNTGNNDFIYNDRYVDKEDSYRHSKWLSFIAKRLKLAKFVLKNNGVLFITIDDNEYAQLKLLCDEIFSENNFIANICWQARRSVSNDAIVSQNHHYVLIYSKNKNLLQKNKHKFRYDIDETKFSNPDNDSRGPWTADPFDAAQIRKNLQYAIKNPNTGETYYPPKGRHWVTTEKEYFRLLKDKRIRFGKNGKSKPQRKRFLEEVRDKGKTPTSWWDGAGTTTQGTKELENVLGEKLFDNPKPVSLLKRILKLSTDKKSIILDFFAGSGTTAHAVLETNFEDGGSRKFILCTNNENNNGNGHKIATDICYPRIQKVIQKLEKEAKGKLVSNRPSGLKYFKTDFVDAEPTDKNKRMLVDKSTEMLCLKEDCFDEVKKGNEYKIFKNSKDKYLGIIYDDEGIETFKQEAKKLNKKIVVFVFSLDESAREEEFGDVEDLVELKPIPAVILNVYKRIFK